MYQLHPRLQADSLALCDLELCEVRLIDDQRYPWLILIPRRSAVSEVHQLCTEDQQRLILESSRAAKALAGSFTIDKINVGALGNLVSQMHWHVVARRRDDAAWPGPVWGVGTPVPYDPEQVGALISRLRHALTATDRDGPAPALPGHPRQ